jgi:hypothetical protein
MPKLQEMAFPDSNFQNYFHGGMLPDPLRCHAPSALETFSTTKSFELASPLVAVEVKFEPH